MDREQVKSDLRLDLGKGTPVSLVSKRSVQQSLPPLGQPQPLLLQVSGSTSPLPATIDQITYGHKRGPARLECPRKKSKTGLRNASGGRES